MQFCQNKGVVQIRYEKDSDPGVWIEDEIPAPFVCYSQVCCSVYIASNTTIYFSVDDDGVQVVDDISDPGDYTLAIGIMVIIVGLIMFMCSVGILAFIRYHAAKLNSGL